MEAMEISKDTYLAIIMRAQTIKMLRGKDKEAAVNSKTKAVSVTTTGSMAMASA
jgi:RecA/RadA recombinase